MAVGLNPLTRRSCQAKLERLEPAMYTLISRSEYNSLVRKYPSWMANVWPKIVGRWYLYGPTFQDKYYKRMTIILNSLNHAEHSPCGDRAL